MESFMSTLRRLSGDTNCCLATADARGIYGEFTPGTYAKFVRVWTAHGLEAPDAAFWHMGAGVGKALVAVSALSACPVVGGVEWNAHAVNVFKRIVQGTRVFLAHGSYLDDAAAREAQKIFVPIPEGTTHIYNFDEWFHVRDPLDFERPSARSARVMRAVAASVNACRTWRVLQTFIPPRMWGLAGLRDFTEARDSAATSLASKNALAGSGSQHRAWLLVRVLV